MSTLVYINSRDGIAKSATEAITYAKKLGEEVIVLHVVGQMMLF